jgi:hypothetical protein
VVIQSRRPDRYFSADKQKRLTELMAQWRVCRAKEESLPSSAQEELDALVHAELRAATDRAGQLADELKR